MSRQIELPENSAALVVTPDGNITFSFPEMGELDTVPHPIAALLGCALQLSENELFVSSMLDWLEEKLADGGE